MDSIQANFLDTGNVIIDAQISRVLELSEEDPNISTHPQFETISRAIREKDSSFRVTCTDVDEILQASPKNHLLADHIRNVRQDLEANFKVLAALEEVEEGELVDFNSLVADCGGKGGNFTARTLKTAASKVATMSQAIEIFNHDDFQGLEPSTYILNNILRKAKTFSEVKRLIIHTIFHDTPLDIISYKHILEMITQDVTISTEDREEYIRAYLNMLYADFYSQLSPYEIAQILDKLKHISAELFEYLKELDLVPFLKRLTIPGPANTNLDNEPIDEEALAAS